MRLASATPVRPLSDVSAAVWITLCGALLVQVLWHGALNDPHAGYEPLSPPPSLTVLRVVAAGEQSMASYALSLWLQVHETQPGYSAPLRELNYDAVALWLQRALELEPRSQYPLLSAIRIYAAVPDEQRRRRMLAFVEEQFLRAPNQRWRWMAEAAIIAKHRLHDLPLALRYAKALQAHATRAPAWAREMTIAVLEDMGELEAARLLIGGLLHDGRLRDPHEIRFLEQRLLELQAAGTARRAGD
ncbi:MAG: hypothetical protein ACI8W7_004331 [Gammaproteobacteria bacterium]|jgi:hypothetical protein